MSKFVSAKMKRISGFYIVFSILLIAYALWEIYWAMHVGSLFIKWHTHLALYVYAGAAVMLGVRALHSVKTIRNYSSIQLSVFVFFAACMCIEGSLIALGIGDTYMEHIKYGYVSRYGGHHEEYYRLHKPNEEFYVTRPEFKHLRKCNLLGFADTEWPVEKKAGEKRILVLGDSFTEGIGAPADSSYPSVLRAMYVQKDSNITVMNAGIAGNDPCVNYVTYRDLLLKYKPDLIVQSLSANDMNTDIATKGGMERFQKDGKVKFRDAPWWEPIYAISYISRLYFTARGYNELLIKTPFPEKEKKELDQKAVDLFKAYGAEAARQGSELVVILQPDQSALYQKKYEYDLAPIAHSIAGINGLKVVDLLPIYLKYFEGMGDSIKNYYWLNDGHHNPKGYAVMATCVKNGLDSIDYYEAK